MPQEALKRRQEAAPARVAPGRQTEAPAAPEPRTAPVKRRSRKQAGIPPPALKIPAGAEPPGLEEIPLREAVPLQEAPETALPQEAVREGAAVHLETLLRKSRIHTML